MYRRLYFAKLHLLMRFLGVLGSVACTSTVCLAKVDTNSPFLWVSDRSGSQQVWCGPSDGSQPIQLTTSLSGTVIIGTYGLSPDRTKVLIANHGDIYAVDLISRGIIRLTFDGTQNDNSMPSWAPTGYQIVFRKRLNQQDAEIYTMNADGSGVQALTNASNVSANPCYAPNGRKIAYDSTDSLGLQDVMSQDAIGTNFNRFNMTHRLGGSNTSPSYSPDGQQIAFIHGNDIWLMNADGTGAYSQLTHSTSGDPAVAGGLSWKADGSEILFSAKPSGGKQNVYAYSLLAGKVSQVTFGNSFDGFPTFGQAHLRPFVWVSDRAGGQQIWMTQAVGLDLIPLTANLSGGARVGPFGLSPDGSKVVFANPGANVGEIWVLDIASRAMSRLTTDGSQNDNGMPAWSPNGAKIAFRKQPGRTGDFEIYTMNSDGSNVQALTSGYSACANPCYSTDGGLVAFDSTGDRGLPDIVVQASAGLNAHRVNLTFGLGGANTNPSFSPDGQVIAFAHADANNQGKGDIWLVNADGSGSPTQVTDMTKGSPPATGGGTTWNPDGSEIYFAATPTGGNQNLYAVNVQNGIFWQVTFGIGNDFCPSFSQNDGPFVWVTGVGGQQIWIGSQDGGGLRQLTPNLSGGATVGPYGLSPNGSQVVYASPAAANGEIWALDTASAAVTRLTTDGNQNGNSMPSWSPGGNLIVFRKRLNQQDYEIFTMNADGSNVQALTSGFNACANPSYSPDGAKIVFDSTHDRGLPDVVVRDLFGFHNLTTGLGGTNSCPSFSPNGKQIAFQHGGEVWVMTATGTSAKQLTTGAGATGAGTSWNLDGTEVFFAASSGGSQNIYAVNVILGITRQVTSGSNSNSNAAFSQRRISRRPPPALGPAPWGMFRANARHSGQATGRGATAQQQWSFFVHNGVSSAAIGSDGTIYFGSFDNNLYALNPDGSLQWKFVTGGYVYSSPAIGRDGTIYAGSSDHYVYAVSPTGTQRWAFQTGGLIDSSPVVGLDGTIYISSRDGYLYALNRDGSQKWKFFLNSIANIIASSPAIGSDGTIYVGSNDGNVYAVNPNGSGKWVFATFGPVSSSPAVSRDGTLVYVGSSDDNVYAINTSNGSMKWVYQTGGPVSSSPAIGDDGSVYVGSDDGYVYSLGTTVWKFQATGFVRSSPGIGADGTIYIGCDDGNVYALNKNGSKQWAFSTGWYINPSPSVGPDGTIYFGSADGYFYALR